MKINLDEAKDLTLYKKLVVVFSDFVDKYPGTGVGNIYRNLVEVGIKSMPSDKKALDILKYVIENYSVSDIMNKRLSELPITLKPVYKQGNTKLCAFYCVDGKLHDRAINLLNFEGKKGNWTDENCEKVSLLDLKISED
jgi:hypothetical protein